MNLIFISKYLNTHEKCIEYLEKMRWNNLPICPYCGSKKSSPKKLRHTCLSCSNSFSVTVDTIFHSTNLPLQKWLMAISLILAAKKGVSSMQLSRDIAVNKNTAWLIQMKIRAALDENKLEMFTDKKGRIRRKRFKRRNFSGRVIVRSMFSFKMNQVIVNKVWGQLKRAIIGQYHQIDEYYLHLYVDEITFKSAMKKTTDEGYSVLLPKLFF